jgi:hypothetical protein
MSLFRNATSRESVLLEAGLSHLLLACQFNFRQKTWGLPLFNDPQDVEIGLHFFHSNPFPDPSMGGVTPMKPLLSRSESGQSGFWEKLKHPTKRKNENE